MTRLAVERRRRRQSANVSLRELARSIDVDPATLSRWEHGSHPRDKGAEARWDAAVAEMPEPWQDFVERMRTKALRALGGAA